MRAPSGGFSGRNVVVGGAAWNGPSVAASLDAIFSVTSPGKDQADDSPGT